MEIIASSSSSSTGREEGNVLIAKAQREASESRAAASLASEGTFIFTPLPNVGQHEQDEHFQQCLRKFCQGEKENLEKSKHRYLRRRQAKYRLHPPNVSVPPISRLGAKADFIAVSNVNEDARSAEVSHLYGPARRRYLQKESKCRLQVDVVLEQREKEIHLAELEEKFSFLLQESASAPLSTVPGRRPVTAAPRIDAYPEKYIVYQSDHPSLDVEGPAHARRLLRESRLRLAHSDRRSKSNLPRAGNFGEVQESQLYDLEIAQQAGRNRRAAEFVVLHSRLRNRDRQRLSLIEEAEVAQLTGEGLATLQDLLSHRKTPDSDSSSSGDAVSALVSEDSSLVSSTLSSSTGLIQQDASSSENQRPSTAPSAVPSVLKGRSLAFLQPTPLGNLTGARKKYSTSSSSSTGGGRRVAFRTDSADQENELGSRSPPDNRDQGGKQQNKRSAWTLRKSSAARRDGGGLSEEDRAALSAGATIRARARQLTGNLADQSAAIVKGVQKQAHSLLAGAEKVKCAPDDFVEAASMGSHESISSALESLRNGCDFRHSRSGLTALFGAIKGLLEAEWQANERSKAKARRAARLLQGSRMQNQVRASGSDNLEQAKKDGILLSTVNDIKLRRQKYCSIIQRLMDAGCKPDCTWQIEGDKDDPRNGWGLLHLASSYAGGGGGVWRLAAWLLRGARCDPNLCTANGTTPLMIAAQNPQGGKLCTVLLSGGANVNARDSSGWSALHHAALRGGSLVAKVLLYCGADHQLVGEGGETAADVAGQAGHFTTQDAIRVYREPRLSARAYLDQIEATMIREDQLLQKGEEEREKVKKSDKKAKKKRKGQAAQ
jgi:hypothetical protein